MMSGKRDAWKILNDFYPKTKNTLSRLGQLIELVNEEVSETTKFQESIINLAESDYFLKNILNVVQDYVDPELSRESIEEIVKIIASSILTEVAASKELIQALDAILIAVRDIPKDIMEAYYGLEFNANFPHKEPQWTADPNKKVTTSITSPQGYHVSYTSATNYASNVQTPKNSTITMYGAKKAPSKKPIKKEEL